MAKTLMEIYFGANDLSVVPINKLHEKLPFIEARTDEAARNLAQEIKLEIKSRERASILGKIAKTKKPFREVMFGKQHPSRIRPGNLNYKLQALQNRLLKNPNDREAEKLILEIVEIIRNKKAAAKPFPNRPYATR